MTEHHSPLAEHLVDAEQERVAAFQSTLEGLQGINVANIQLYLDGPEPVRAASQQFLHYAPERQAVEPALYVHPEYVAMTETSKLTFAPFRSHGGKGSAHGVFFGELVTSDGQKIEVAVKPLADDPEETCLTDYLNNVAMRQLGVETLQPVGFILDRDGTAYSLTKLEPTLHTLDGINWQALAARPNGEEAIATIWSQVARQAAMLHSFGKVMHGDLAPRNIARRPDDNSSVMFIDWEKASISRDAPNDPEVRYQHSRPDMGELMESMLRRRNDSYKPGIGLLDGDAEQCWAQFKHLVLAEYSSTRLAYAANEQDMRDIKDELTELENSLRNHMKLVLAQTGRVSELTA